MNKTHILDEIRRTAEANGGTPLGMDRFEDETGITQADWFGKFWARWGDAVREAGLAPNKLNTAFEDEHLLDAYADYARDLGRLPVSGDLRLKRKSDRKFPSWNTFARLGSKADLVSKLLDYCRSRPGLSGVVGMCEDYLSSGGDDVDAPNLKLCDEAQMGFVYLMRSGNFYKIGWSNSVGRREYELGIQLPEAVAMVHAIRTDDPPGIEAYWHNRFADKRKNGEWFKLDADDVRAFKRRKFM
jgi:hypothetical protein